MFVGHSREKRLLDMKLVFYLNGHKTCELGKHAGVQGRDLCSPLLFPCYFCPALVFFAGVGAERAGPNIWGPEGMTGHFA